MAQFQILYLYSDTEWRPITIECCPAPTGDQQYFWSSFEEAEAARQELLKRAPDTRFRIVVAGAEIGDVDWQTREKLRFADGTYSTTPWHDEPWYQARHDEHFCHVSTEQAGKIAFTENAAKAQLDRQLVMSPGRYLHRYFSGHLDNDAIEGWCARLSVQLAEDTLKITQDADEIEDVYVGGPSSCMAHGADEFDSSCHPTRAYAGPDTALAYIGTRADAKARSVVWPSRKIYTTIYGDVSRLKLLLENAGYTEGGLNGARIRRIEDGDRFVVPYIDAGDDLGDDGDYLVIGRGPISSESTNGLGHCPWYCPRCDSDESPYSDVHFADGSSEEWCFNCYENHTTYCEHNQRSYSDVETFVTVHANRDTYTVLEEDVRGFGAVYLEGRGEWWVSSCCRLCDGSGEWFHIDDLAEYHGEWLSEDELPEPFDDDDASLANAHVLAFHQFRDAMAAIRSEIAQWEAVGAQAQDERLRRGAEETERVRVETLRHNARDARDMTYGQGDCPNAPRSPADLISATAMPAPIETASHAGV